MADPNYQPQQQNLYGFSNGIPGIVGGSSAAPLLQQARTSTAPAVYGDGASEGGRGGGDGSMMTPEQSAFFDSETAAARDARMSNVSDLMGKGLTMGAGLTGVPGAGLLVGLGTGQGMGGKIGNALQGFFNSAGNFFGERSENTMSPAAMATAYGQGGPSTGVYGGYSASSDNDAAQFGTADAPAGSDGGGGGAPQGGNAGLGDAADGKSSPFAAGGLVTPASAPPMPMPAAGAAPPPTGRPGLSPPGAPAGPTDPRMVDAQVANLLRTKPETARKLQMMAQQAIQSGETTPEQIQQLGQIARVCLQNPAMYPRLVQMAEQRGIVGPGELPPTYDESVIKKLIAIAAVMAQSSGAPAESEDYEEDDAMEMRRGGMIRGPGTGTSDSIPGVNTSNGGKVKVSNGEYIIPAKVVAIKGKEFFDNLLRKYADVSGERGAA